MSGLIRIPGFIDAHVHVESSHLVPSEFGKTLLRHGTVAAICDPHEIVNVCGEEGLRFMLKDAEKSPSDLFFELPSCVPATPFETSGSALTAADTRDLFERYPQLVGLGEVMDASGVVRRDPEAMKKIETAKKIGKIVEGHFPGGRGEALKRYAEAGITSDHEATTKEEALEKISLGMTVFIREGSSAKNLDDLIGAVTPENADRFCFCADDVSAADLIENGDVLRCFRKAVQKGLPLELAIRIACENPRKYFRLPEEKDTFVLLDEKAGFSVVKVVKNGREFR